MPEIDIEKTDIVVKLMETPQPERTAAWMSEFFAAVDEAAFDLDEKDAIFTGPDKFPYLRFTIPPADKEFRAFSIKNVLDQALEQGVGLVIFPEDLSAPLWVFTYGNLLSYKLTGQFDARQPAPENVPPPAPDRQVLVSQPSETFLPPPARKILRKYLQMNGIGVPAVFLLTDPAMNPSQQLVFNLFKDNYQDENHFKEICYRITWYLPPHYSFVTLPDKNSQFQTAFAAM